ncbi:conserved hypothetical protein [Thiomonas sp. CB3]|nr:conserved hypothetical protein [Thiomonas sp. CB3]
MPTILFLHGLCFAIYLDDHRPAHVHVKGAKKEAVFVLHCPDGPPELRETYGFGRAELKRVADLVEQHLAELCAAWSQHHGNQ